MQNCLSSEFNDQIKHLVQELSERSNCSIQIHPDAKSHMSKFFSKLRTKWQEAKRNMNFFLQKNEKWLEVNMSFPTRSNMDKLSIRGRPRWTLVHLVNNQNGERLKSFVEFLQLKNCHTQRK